MKLSRQERYHLSYDIYEAAPESVDECVQALADRPEGVRVCIGEWYHDTFLDAEDIADLIHRVELIRQRLDAPLAESEVTA